MDMLFLFLFSFFCILYFPASSPHFSLTLISSLLESLSLTRSHTHTHLCTTMTYDGNSAWEAMIIATITPKRPKALPKISITRILTNNVLSMASASAQLDPITPTQILCGEIVQMGEKGEGICEWLNTKNDKF